MLRYLRLPFAALLLGASFIAEAQVGIGTPTPHSSAALEVSTTTKGLLPPRMTQTQRNAIGTPAAGLTIYNISSGKLNTWNGTAWAEAVSTTEQPIAPTTSSLTFTGGAQTYVVPAGITRLVVDASGAQGGSNSDGTAGGLGGRVQTTITVTPGEVLTVYVGGAGSTASFSSTADGFGYNGGGGGRFLNGGGGGATDIRRGGTALANRVVVAGGGGGSSNAGTSGGDGGGLTGGTGLGSFPGLGGTQSAGGAGGDGVGPGTLGQGGTGNFTGGGGGYWGGGGGGRSGSSGGGGGGSSFVTAVGSSGTIHTQGSKTGNGVVTFNTLTTYVSPALDGSNFVNVPGTYDNLGNHLATQALNLGANALVGNGGTTGLTIAGGGTVTAAAALTTGGAITAGGNVQLGANALVGNGGTTGLTVTSAGRVGIGGIGATQVLDVNGGILARSNSAVSTQGAYLHWNRTNGDGETWLLNQKGGGAANAGIRFGSVTTGNVATEWGRFLDNGNFGIGVTNPSQKLEVAGQIFSNTGGFRFPDNTVQTTAAVTATGANFIQNQATPQASSSFNITGTGTIGGNATVAGTSTVTGNSYVNGALGVVLNGQDRPLITRGYDAFTSGNYTGAGRWGVFMEANNLTLGVPAIASRNFQWATYNANSTIGSTLMTLLQNGNLGIGTPTPGQKLEVNGTALINSTYDLLLRDTNHGLGWYGTGKLWNGASPDGPVLYGYNGGLLGTNQAGTRVTALAWNSSGQVGIGTAPTVAGLSISTAEKSGSPAVGGVFLSGGASGNANVEMRGGTPYLDFASALNVDFASRIISDANALNFHVGASSVPALTILGNTGGLDRVGINTTSPIAPLHVKGAALNAVASGNASFFNQGGGFNAINNSSGNKVTTAYFESGEVWVNGFIVAGTLNTTSDRRIKQVVSLSDHATDLTLLNQLRITNYTYIDQLNNQPGVVKKVIAQEVEEVLPAAVSRSTQALPNVYERATSVAFANGQVTVTMAKPHELPATGGRMRFYTPTNAGVDVAVTVVDAHTVRFASTESHAAGLFVYGKYVNDFRSVDYDALSMLNVSATQELARKVAALEAQNAALRAAQNSDHAALQTLQEQMARLLGEATPGSQARK